MAISYSALRLSYWMRGYMLEIFLVSVIGLRFLIFLKKQNIKNMILYAIPGILIVNTHYYGSLLVGANFLFFIVYNLSKKTFRWKIMAAFFCCNLFIAATLAPFFIITAYKSALLNKDFNTWLDKPRKFITFMSLGSPVIAAVYILGRKFLINKKWIDKGRVLLLDYMVFVTGIIFLSVYFPSLIRSIYSKTYFAICFPFLIAGVSVALTLNFPGRILKFAALVFTYLSLMVFYYKKPLGYLPYDAYKEGLAFMSFDMAAHPERKSAALQDNPYIPFFYGRPRMELYTPGEDASGYPGVLYRLRKPKASEDKGNILIIRINETRSVIKTF
jgi:hypothetical protein